MGQALTQYLPQVFCVNQNKKKKGWKDDLILE